MNDSAEYDVLVIGCGYAGAMSALAASRAGASVCVLEKAPHPGGISICSAGGLRIAENEAQAMKYLIAANAGRTPEPVLSELARGMTRLPDLVRELARINGAEISVRPSPGNYPFPGYETFGFVYVDAIPSVDIRAAYPYVRGNPAGALLFKVLWDNLVTESITVLCNAAASRLIRKDGRIAGVLLADGRVFRARKGVILACGGFEANPEMQGQYWPGGPAWSAAYKYNTGDGIRMAVEMGADLWHMWHYHGCYGFPSPNPDYPYGIRVKRLPDWRPGADTSHLPLMAWILLNKAGRRFMNEYEPYTHDTGARPLSVYDPALIDYPRNPAFLITDEPGRLMYPLGKPLYNDSDAHLNWSPDNSKEIESGILIKADSPEGLARKLGLPPDGVQAAVESWNWACESARDPDFGRPPSSMHPLLEAPYYGSKIVPVVSNTQGGPRRDDLQRVLDPFGRPIPGLYAVGECGSAFGFLYMSGCNLAECFISGEIAGRQASLDVFYLL